MCRPWLTGAEISRIAFHLSVFEQAHVSIGLWISGFRAGLLLLANEDEEIPMPLPAFMAPLNVGFFKTGINYKEGIEA